MLATEKTASTKALNLICKNPKQFLLIFFFTSKLNSKQINVKSDKAPKNPTEYDFGIVGRILDFLLWYDNRNNNCLWETIREKKGKEETHFAHKIFGILNSFLCICINFSVT